MSLSVSSNSDLYSSWYFSDDNGVGTSLDNNTSSEFSTENFEKQVCDLHVLRQKLLELERTKETVLKEKGGLEAEKTLLLTSLKTKLLLHEFREKYESESSSRLCSIGNVSIQEVKLCFSTTLLKKYKHYFLCVLTCGSGLFASQILEADRDGVINFGMNHTFLNLAVDFEISVKIYILRVQKKTFRHKVKKFLCWSNGAPDTTPWRRESMFKFWKETVINISNVNETNEIFLDLVNSKLCKVIVDVSAKVDVSGFTYSGWVDVSRNGLFWNQRWCVLQGTLLKCFNYPVDNFLNNAITTIDLNSCSSVRISGPYEESRSKVIVLEMDDDLTNPFSFYLSTNSTPAFKQWRILEKIVPTLQAWKNSSLV